VKEVVNYYEELKISQAVDLAEIKQKLAELRNAWVSRQTTFPVKANKIIVLLDEADEVFVSEATRQKYDKDLEESKRASEVPDPDADRAANFKRWYDEATKFFNNRQFDLAKSAIDKAIQYQGQSIDDADFYRFAAETYRQNNLNERALEFINQAIIINVGVAAYYIAKYFIQDAIVSHNQNTVQVDIDAIVQEEKASLEEALRIATQNNDLPGVAAAYDLLAYVWCYRSGWDVNRATEFANKALATGQAQMCHNSQKVLNDIKEWRKNQELQQLEQALHQELQRLGPRPETDWHKIPVSGGQEETGFLMNVALTFGVKAATAPAVKRWDATHQEIFNRYKAARQEILNRYAGYAPMQQEIHAKKFCKKCGGTLGTNGVCTSCGTYYPL